MNKKSLLTLWAGMFILCAALGFVPAPAGFLKILMVALALGFFVPPSLLLWHSVQRKDRQTVMLIRNLAALSLLVTLVLLVANILSVLGSEMLGDLLNAVLVIASTPMACGQYWILSLFCWAFLMISAHSKLPKKKKRTA